MSALSAADRLTIRRATTVHEASHAVVDLIFGISFRNVEVINDDSGVVRTRGKVEPGTEREHAVALAAGLAGELIWLSRTRHLELEAAAHDGAAWDTRHLLPYARKAGVSVPKIRSEAHSLLLRRWPSVMELAGLLHRRKMVTEARARSASRLR